MNDLPPEDTTPSSPRLRQASPGEPPSVDAESNEQRPKLVSRTTSLSTLPVSQSHAVAGLNPAPAHKHDYIDLNLRCLLEGIPTARLGFDPRRVPMTVKTRVPLGRIHPHSGSDFGSLTLRDIVDGCQQNHQAAFSNSALDEQITVRMEAVQNRIAPEDIILRPAESPFKPMHQYSPSPFTPADAQSEAKKVQPPVEPDRISSPFKPVQEKQPATVPPSPFRNTSATPRSPSKTSLSEPCSSVIDNSHEETLDAPTDPVACEDRTDASPPEDVSPSRAATQSDFPPASRTSAPAGSADSNRTPEIGQLPQNEIPRSFGNSATRDPLSHAEDSRQAQTTSASQSSSVEQSSAISAANDIRSVEVSDRLDALQIRAVVISNIDPDLRHSSFDQPAESTSSLTLQEVLDRASEISGVLSAAIFIKQGSQVRCYEGTHNSGVPIFAREVREVYGKFAKVANDLSIGNARTITVRTNRGAFSFFESRNTCLAVQHEKLQFHPGTEESLSSLARTLAEIKETGFSAAI